MTTQSTIIDLIVSQIENMSSSELFELHNTFCQSANYLDDEIYNNDEDFFNTYFEGRPAEVARSCFYGDYNYSHDYVKFNGYGNLVSLYSIGTDDLPDLVQNVAEHINDNREDYDMFDFDNLESQLEDEQTED